MFLYTLPILISSMAASALNASQRVYMAKFEILGLFLSLTWILFTISGYRIEL